LSLKKGSTLEVDIEKFADRGKSLAHVDGQVVFVQEAVPGDRVRIEVFRKRKKFVEAKILELLEPSDLRTTPRCRYFGTCGGCKWQHVQYEAQLEAKRQSVAEALEHVGGFSGLDVRPTIGSEKPYFYRNKMEFSFSADRWLTPVEIGSGMEYDTSFALGLHVPGNFYKVLDLHECHLQSSRSAEIVNAVRDFARENEWLPWDIRNHTGFLRHLVIREGERTGERMINLVTSGHDEDRMRLFAEFLQRQFPETTTLVNTVNSTVAQTSFGEAMHTVFGPGVIRDRIGRFTFEIAPNAFFQTNTAQAERLYEVARDAAELQADDVLFDLYCGAGTISIFMAAHVKRVVGVEVVEEAVQNAKANARTNGVDNCTFIAADMLSIVNPRFTATHGRPDVVIVDPPRAGLHPKVVQRLARLRAKRLVYVSCNPQTQARDLQLLGGEYRIDTVQPVDLFPHTDHVETVVRLTHSG
jgi:23S rRNA (uracil1939-C5)-methyltransferase